MILVIIDYNTAKVWYTNVKKGITSEECEELIVELEFNLDEVHYMVAPSFECEELILKA